MPSRISLRPLLATQAGYNEFVGREAELTSLLANIDVGANTLVLAQRGAGLTSFLNRVVFELEGRDDLHVVVVAGEVAHTTADLLAVVADRLAALQTRELAAVPDRPELATEAAGLLWRVDRIAQLVAGLGTRVVVMIDGIGSAAVAHTVFGQLRNELWQMDAITWVLGGAHAQRGRYLEPPADAFWESVIELSPLSNDDLFVILTKRKLAGRPPDTLDAVMSSADGNPMKLLIAARAAEEGRLPGQLEHDPQLTESAARLINYLQVNGPASASDKGLLSQLGWSRGRAQQVLSALEHAGLVSAERAPADGGPGAPRKVYHLTDAAR